MIYNNIFIKNIRKLDIACPEETSLSRCLSVFREEGAQPRCGWLGEEHKQGDSGGTGSGTKSSGE